MTFKRNFVIFTHNKNENNMPYITSDLVKKFRTQIRKEFPEYKISVTRQDLMLVRVDILSGPIDLLTNTNEKYVQINEYYIENRYKEYPSIKNFLLRIKEIITSDYEIESIDSDYGSIPNYYIRINIGQWNRPYEVKTKI